MENFMASLRRSSHSLTPYSQLFRYTHFMLMVLTFNDHKTYKIAVSRWIFFSSLSHPKPSSTHKPKAEKKEMTIYKIKTIPHCVTTFSSSSLTSHPKNYPWLYLIEIYKIRVVVGWRGCWIWAMYEPKVLRGTGRERKKIRNFFNILTSFRTIKVNTIPFI